MYVAFFSSSMWLEIHEEEEGEGWSVCGMSFV